MIDLNRLLFPYFLKTKFNVMVEQIIASVLFVTNLWIFQNKTKERPLYGQTDEHKFKPTFRQMNERLYFNTFSIWKTNLHTHPPHKNYNNQTTIQPTGHHLLANVENFGNKYQNIEKI